MPRYIDAAKLIEMIDEDIVCLTKDGEDTKQLIMEQIGKNWFAPPCDVVPRNEVDEIVSQALIETRALLYNAHDEIAELKQAEQEVAREIFDYLKGGLKDLIKTFKNSTLEFEKGVCRAFERVLDEIEYIEKKYIGE